MSINFTINGQSVDLTDADSLANAGVTFGGSVVNGSTYGVSGGTVTGTVYGTEEHDGNE